MRKDNLEVFIQHVSSYEIFVISKGMFATWEKLVKDYTKTINILGRGVLILSLHFKWSVVLIASRNTRGKTVSLILSGNLALDSHSEIWEFRDELLRNHDSIWLNVSVDETLAVHVVYTF